MDYYMIKNDTRIKYPLEFKDYINKKVKQEDVVIHANITEQTKMVDYAHVMEYTKVYYIFSEEVRKVINGYNMDVGFYGVIVTSRDLKNQYTYWRIDTKTLEKYIIDEMCDVSDYVFQLIKVKNEVIFCIAQNKQEYIGFREDLAESIMRRYPIGIKFAKLKVSER